MLVLTRHPGEEIIIDGTIRLTVVSVKGDRIRVGIDAPPSVVVDRQEIHERRQRSPDSVAGRCCVAGPAEKEAPDQLLTPMVR
jgi:carbon storage regulator